jgi:hypothetical protein
VTLGTSSGVLWAAADAPCRWHCTRGDSITSADDCLRLAGGYLGVALTHASSDHVAVGQAVVRVLVVGSLVPLCAGAGASALATLVKKLITWNGAGEDAIVRQMRRWSWLIVTLWLAPLLGLLALVLLEKFWLSGGLSPYGDSWFVWFIAVPSLAALLGVLARCTCCGTESLLNTQVCDRVRGEMMGFIESPCLGKRMHSDSICAACGCGWR